MGAQRRSSPSRPGCTGTAMWQAPISRGLALLNAVRCRRDGGLRLRGETAKNRNDPVMGNGRSWPGGRRPRHGAHGYDAMRAATQIAEHALAPDIAVDAWMLIAEKRRAQRDSRRPSKPSERVQTGTPVRRWPRRRAEAGGHGMHCREAMPPPRGPSTRFPAPPVLAGTLDVVATAPECARVEFLLDDAASTTRPRRSAPILPRRRTARAHPARVAYDDTTRHGRGSVTINEQSSGCRSRSASRSRTTWSSGRGRGDAARTGREVIEGVDVYWNKRNWPR